MRKVAKRLGRGPRVIALSAPSACGRTLRFPRLEDRDQTTLDSLRDELRQLLIGLVPLPDGFDGKANLYSEPGMSSLKAIELLMTLEERHGVTVPDKEFIECTSLECSAEMMQRLKI